MPDSSHSRTERNSTNPYQQNAHSGPRLGEVTQCELCEREIRCFEQCGITACRDCHHELLPGEDVF